MPSVFPSRVPLSEAGARPARVTPLVSLREPRVRGKGGRERKTRQAGATDSRLSTRGGTLQCLGPYTEHLGEMASVR